MTSARAARPTERPPPSAKPAGYEAAFGDYGPQFYEGATPVLWGFKLLAPVGAHLGEAGFRALQAVGSWYYKRSDQPPAYYLITTQLTRQDAIVQYGAVTAEEFGAFGSWQATTFGTTRLTCRSVRVPRSAPAVPVPDPRPPRILLLEQHQPSQAIMRVLLEQAGLRVDVAATSAGLRSVLADQPPAVLVLGLPVADLSAAAARALVQASTAQGVGVVVCGPAAAAAAVAAPVPAAATLPKPFDIDEFVSTVQRLTGCTTPHAA